MKWLTDIAVLARVVALIAAAVAGAITGQVVIPDAAPTVERVVGAP